MASAQWSDPNQVVVVGAGPAGLLLPLMLSRQNVPTLLLDASSALDNQPRATHYGPPAVYELKRAGVLDDVRAEGFMIDGVCWRKLDGTYIAGMSVSDLPKDYPYKVTCLPLNQLGKILMKHIETRPNVKVRWGAKVTSVGQDEKKAWCELENGEKIEGRYLVGCDGANSIVRRTLFGDLNFPGHTWDEQIVATNTYIDLDKFKWLDSNFIIHKEHWYMAAKIGTGMGRKGLWRITYGEIPGLSRDELRERLPWKFESFLPGHPKPDEYEVANFSPYKVHQRLAERMRVGRILLAADAAHLCNPFGGMGLTGGIADVDSLVDALVGIYTGQADESILDKYDEVRRNIYNEIINPVSSSNLIRMHKVDPDTALETDDFMRQLSEAAKDPKLSAEIQMGAEAIKVDMTQYYNTKSAL